MNGAIGCGLLGILAVACGASDDAPSVTCGTAEAPLPIEIRDVSPAVGASVPNFAIVETFTIVGGHLKVGADFAVAHAHTAGASTWHWTYTESGNDTVYVTEPRTWEHAPAHVEFETAGLYQTTDGCFWSPPKQLFKYDVTVP